MHRIDGAGHDNHAWVAEDPATNRPPTEITAAFMNAVQEEIAHVVEGAGIPLNKANNTQLRQAIAALIAESPTLLPGSVIYFARTTAPTGYLKANGAAVSRTTYAALFTAIGTTFGAGDGATTFNLPDLRGEFIRGWDDGRGIDSGRVFGSAQGDAIRNITGTFIAADDNGATGAFAVTGTTSAVESSGTYPSKTITFNAAWVVPTAAENRPHNIALLACIKY